MKSISIVVDHTHDNEIHKAESKRLKWEQRRSYLMCLAWMDVITDEKIREELDAMDAGDVIFYFFEQIWNDMDNCAKLLERPVTKDELVKITTKFISLQNHFYKTCINDNLGADCYILSQLSREFRINIRTFLECLDDEEDDI